MNDAERYGCTYQPNPITCFRENLPRVQAMLEEGVTPCHAVAMAAGFESMGYQDSAEDVIARTQAMSSGERRIVRMLLDCCDGSQGEEYAEAFNDVDGFSWCLQAERNNSLVKELLGVLTYISPREQALLDTLHKMEG